MKKIFYLSIVLIVLIVAIVVVLIACEKKKKNVQPVEPEIESVAPVVLPSASVVNEETFSVDFTNYNFDEFGNFFIDVTCENRISDKVLVFSIDRVSVNNYMIDPWWAVEVKPNCTSNSTITFERAELKRNNIENVVEINFDISVYNSDDLLEDSIYEENYTLKVN